MNRIDASGAERPSLPSLNLHRRASGLALGELCADLQAVSQEYEDIKVLTPDFDDNGPAQVALFRGRTLTIGDAALLQGMSKGIFFRQLRRKAPSLQDEIHSLQFHDIFEIDGDHARHFGLLEKHTPGETGILGKEILTTWEVLQATADALQKRRGEKPQSLEQDLQYQPVLWLANVGSETSDPQGAFEAVRAVLVRRRPLQVDRLTHVLPKPYTEAAKP
jgi:hypothetical protein